MNDQNMETLLYENKVYTAWQFVVNTDNTIRTVHFCKDAILSLNSNMAEETKIWRQEISDKLIDSPKTDDGKKSIAVTTDNLPAYDVDVAGVHIPAGALINKLAKDFFQYARNAFDCMAQVINAGCLGNKADSIEKVDFSAIRKVIEKSYKEDFPEIAKWMESIAESPEFSYVDAFCNRTKHICDVHLKISLAVLGGDNEASINPFYKKKEQRKKQDLTEYLSDIVSFLDNAFADFIEALKKEVPKRKYVDNRIHKLKVYQQKFVDKSEISFSAVYIDADKPAEDMPDEIQIMLLHQYDSGEIIATNCNIDTVYINDPTEKCVYIGKYVATDAYVDDTLLQYRKYKKELQPEKTSFYIQAMLDPLNQSRCYRYNPYMDILTISDDPEFRIRVQLPF